MLPPPYAPRIAELALGSALAIALALAAISSAGAQGPDVQITQLECIDDPDVEGIQEVVVIENLGDAAQTLTGWELQSDPPDSETFDLVVLGGLASGASISIQSGPSAVGVFKWGDEFIFRDDDPTDYVRLVDDTGAVVNQVNCGAEATPTPSPTPSPQPSPVNGIPNGGGPPLVSDGGLSPLMMMLLGGSMAAAGLLAIALLRLQPRWSLVTASSACPAGPREGKGGSHRSRIAALSDIALLGIVAAVALLVFVRRRA